jgi:hypothetical protein
MEANKLEHRIDFYPAWDKSDPDPKKSYGVMDVVIKFLVIGDKGIVEFELHTNWYLPHVMERRLQHMQQDVLLGNGVSQRRWIYPYPSDVCYWSRERISDDDTHFERGLVGIFNKSPVYYGYKYTDEGGGVYTPDFLYKLLIEAGESDVWEYLEKYYHEVFG